MTTLRHCILTGYQFEEPEKFGEELEAAYTFQPVGKVRVALPTLISLINSRQFRHPILAGICRNAFERNAEPPLITQEFIDSGFKNISYPKSFKEKCRYFLKHLYDNGGNNFKKFSFFNVADYPICFAEDQVEFSSILNYLEENFFIKWHTDYGMAGDMHQYDDVQMTDYGIEEIEKDLPNIPLIGLVSQVITTGDSNIDEKINHAKDLFFKEPQTADRMRSACETLSYILEPLRQDVKSIFSSKDTEDFFHIVNSFDIRHNKEHTKNIEHPEQLEWVFYSLLNTINTYTKLKLRLEK